jgi:phage regulator Rha-like protein
MNNIIKQTISMTSLQIAELTGKRHDNVLRDIRVISDQCEASNLRFLIKSITYTASNGLQYPCYE